MHGRLDIEFLYTKSLEKSIRSAFLKEFEKRFNLNKDKLIEELAKQTYKTFVNTSEYIALTEDVLLGEFGLPQATAKARVNSVIKTFSKQIKIEYKRGYLTFYIIKNDLTEILSLSAASHKSKKGFEVKWLEWLLTQGDRIIIIGYDFYPYYGLGRSGKGVMNKGDFNVWRVPPEYAGTQNDNWITRTLKVYIPFYQRLIPDLIIDHI